MPECGSQAVLMITTSPEGTTTSIVRRRLELRCGLSQGHDGRHRDGQHGEEWEESRGSRPPTLLRQEDEDS
jgi:hypothetical protein